MSTWYSIQFICAQFWYIRFTILIISIVSVSVCAASATNSYRVHHIWKQSYNWRCEIENKMWSQASLSHSNFYKQLNHIKTHIQKNRYSLSLLCSPTIAVSVPRSTVRFLLIFTLHTLFGYFYLQLNTSAKCDNEMNEKVEEKTCDLWMAMGVSWIWVVNIFENDGK